MLAALWPSERTVGSLVEEFGVSQPIVSQQLAVLREAGLVSVRVDGPRRLYRAQPDRLDDVRRYLEAFWDVRLDRLVAATHENRPT
jgi:DNA-binding transcriptional ArsR family regulator